MSYPAPIGGTAYTFASITFYHLVEGGDAFPPWFASESIYTKDLVLGGSASYLDIGATQTAPFSRRFACTTEANRTTLIAALGTTGTLTNDRGRTASATLVKASPIDGPLNWPWVELTFELRP